MVGGGTGLTSLLRGLKRYVSSAKDAAQPSIEITAVVTTTDDGGSSGRLRRDFDVLPPGDIRNCMVALSEDEALLSRLFNYRFAAGRGLKGHSFGNLFLTALTELTGDFPQAVRVSSEILASRGRIFPSTTANVMLEATLENGRIVTGETKISKSRSRISEIRLKPRRCRPLQATLAAFSEADLITFGPGSLYTSIVPNLLVNGVPEAIESSRAIKAYFVNLMWQPGETIGFTAADHVAAIAKHAGGRSIMDYVIVNTTLIAPALLSRYEQDGSYPVLSDNDRLEAMGLKVVGAPLALDRNLVRHDPGAAAAIAIKLASHARQRVSPVAISSTA